MTNQQGAPEALRLAAEVLDWMPTSDTQRALWDRHQKALVVVKAALVEAQQPAPSAAAAVGEVEPVFWMNEKGHTWSHSDWKQFPKHRAKYPIPLYAHRPAPQPSPTPQADSQPAPDGWADADADAARLALELECLLMDTKDAAVVSKWWASANDALEMHRARLKDMHPPATAQADSHPVPDEIVSVAREQGLPETEIEGVFRVNADDLCRVVAADRAARAPADSGAPPAGGLHPKTANLVQRFAAALAEKLASAEKKYGYSDGWSSPDWMDECRQKLAEHVAKGDPRDVAAYCAFLWHHEASTAPTSPAQAADSVLEDAARLEFEMQHGSAIAAARKQGGKP